MYERSYQQGPSDETLKNARCQFCRVKFGHRIIEVVDFFDDKMRNFTQITFSEQVKQVCCFMIFCIILHKWYFCKLYIIK